MHNVHKLCKKEQKMRFIAIFSSLGSRYDLITDMMVVLNVSQHAAAVIGHENIRFINYS